jgi:hypothetical protein
MDKVQATNVPGEHCLLQIARAVAAARENAGTVTGARTANTVTAERV